MKPPAVLLIVFIFLQSSLAQDVSGLPACGQYCVNQASSIAVATANCNTNHANCYCTRGDFVNQVKTCVLQQCTSTTDQATVNAYASGYCGDATAGSTSSAGQSSTAYASTLSTATSTSSTTSSGAPGAATPAPASDQPTGSSGLSTGAKAGIGAGVPLGVIAVGALLFLTWRSRRKNTSPPQDRVKDIPEVDGSVAAQPAPKYEPKELYVPPPVIHELPTGNGQERR